MLSLLVLVLLSLVLLTTPSIVVSFTVEQYSVRFRPLYGFMDTLFSGEKTSNKSDPKSMLLEACRKEKPDRNEIETIILKEFDSQATAASPLLQKEWELIWTTEKEINFFLNQGLAERITQTIDGNVLTNNIPFIKGGSFGVVGSLNIPDPKGIRTEFTFEQAILDIGKWGTYRLPPVGKGWFDTIYLDDNLRVDVNSRNDILICRPSL